MSSPKMLALDLLDFIDAGKSPFQVVIELRKRLNEAGFEQLDQSKNWKLSPGGEYYLTINESALIAFRIGTELPQSSGFHLVGAHTDAPTFRIKPAPDMAVEQKYLKLNTEVYGGPIINTWLDRPLTIAGRVALSGRDIFTPDFHPVNIDKPLLVIPNLAIHMNREVNKGIELNRQNQIQPLLQLINSEMETSGFLLKMLAEELSISPADIIDFDLVLAEYGKGCLVGPNEEFVSTGRLDDLGSVHAGLEGLLRAETATATSVLVCFDNEEVGSSTRQGADSPVLSHTLERIVLAQGGSREDFLRSLMQSFIISADAAHALHPNWVEKADPTNQPVFGGGPVIKIAASRSYTSDAHSSTVFDLLCQQAKVPVQRFVNRSDARSGSTIGPLSSTQLPIPSVDVGTAILAMHSIREMCSVDDHWYLSQVLTEFFQS